MANRGFVRTLNLSEIELGAQTIQNLAGGTVDADLRVFAGLSSERSQFCLLYTSPSPRDDT